MHIKTLVLDNFKSFGRKTELPFYNDFSTVSGPNGSGKSNIIDAILFGLGLARSHGIRAEKLTDLIYTPNADHPENGPDTATVEVVLDNTDDTLSRDQVVAAAGTDDIGGVDEIRIKRRVKRTEDNYYSYYYLNGRSVNLSDIHDLLSQAGVTPEGYNIVMQGDVTGITSMTPYRRREIIDEIAGVAEFDAKKADALDELEVVKDRVHEAELRIEEKRDRLDQLKDERETALEYQGLREEKHEYESYRKAAELEEKRDDQAATQRDLADRRDQLATHQATLDEHDGRVARLEDSLEDLNREIERKGEDEQLGLKRDIEEIKGEIARLDGEIDAATDRIQEAETERRNAFVEIDRKQEQLDQLETTIRERKLEKASVKADIQQLEAEHDDITAEIDEIGAEYEDLKTELDTHKTRLETARTEKNDLQREQDRLLDEARRRSNEHTELTTERDTLEDRLDELAVTRRDLKRELEKARQERAEIEDAITTLRDRKDTHQAELADIEADLQAKQQEYAELEAKAGQSGDSSYGRAVTSVLNADITGVHGTVAQLGSVPEQYATACETAAGARLANVVVADDAVGQHCIEHLKRNNAGRATFLPLTKIDHRSLPRRPDREGVIDFAYNLVEFDDDYRNIFSYVLSDTLVVDTLQTARALMGQYRLVTLAGDLVERSGAMTGGSTRGTRYSFTSSTGRLQRVAEEIETLEADRRTCRDQITRIETQLEDARDRKADATDAVREIETELDATNEERTATTDRIDAIDDRLQEIADERGTVDTRMRELDAEIRGRDDQIDQIQAAIDDIEDDLADSRIPELTEQADAKQQEIRTLEDRANEIDAALNELQLEHQYTTDGIDDLTDRIETAQNRKAEHEARIADLEAEIDTKHDALADKQAAVEALEDELAERKAERESLRDDLADAIAERDEHHETVRHTQNRVQSLEATIDRLEAEITALQEVVGEYDPDDIPDHDEVQRNINRLDRAMTRLEPVNMLAIDEYDRVQDDLADLQDRRDTLEEERHAIHDRIDTYEQQKKAAFTDAFESIDTHFQDVFARLSDGTGELLLENPDDPFEAGLTMRAKPGDKPVQRLDAMSGGEKSLTALAFIFAIQRHNPAPFYVFDEIDAFLDAANAERVGQMLDELAATAQFIVVSHRSALLERSDRAIGVTMQDNNTSAVTGIALADGGAPSG